MTAFETGRVEVVQASLGSSFDLHHHDEQRGADMQDRAAVIETVCTAITARFGTNCLDVAGFADRWCLIDALH